MMIGKYPKLEDDIIYHGQLILEKKILPSMRMLQFAGPAIIKNESRGYNCSYLPIDDYRAFSEVMFLLLGGTGVGYSVQKHHVDNLPEIRKPNKERKFLIGDSIEGWADSVKALMKSYFGYSRTKPRFDFSDIREKGAELVTAGGKAPGPEPLKECLFKIEQILERKSDGDKLRPIEVHDIVCHIANAVLAGGIRRAALISLFSFDDDEMRACKAGAWWELNEQRGRANNSAVNLLHRSNEKDFKGLVDVMFASGSGEPGVFNSNDKDWAGNPCLEISLRPFQFCNLTTINATSIDSEIDFYRRAEAAAFFGTLQAGFTDFHYIRDIWRRTTEKEALLGVSITGIASYKINPDWLAAATECVKTINSIVAKKIGINKGARLTAIKPEGTSSLVCGSSSGIHPWYAEYYIRRIRVGKNEAIYSYLKENLPELVEDEVFRPNDMAVIQIPVKAPDGAETRHENAISILERVKLYNTEWVRNGHRSGVNFNNVSATIPVDSHEEDEVREWMWENRNFYTGLTILPRDNGTYVQAPFEEITKETYDEMSKHLNDIDLSKVIEDKDNTDLKMELACAGGSCEIV